VTGRYAYDPAQAVTLMDSTGFMDTDGDGIRENEGEPVSIDVVTPPWGLNAEVAILLEQQWETTLGIEVNLIEVPSFPALLDAAESGAYNLIGLNFFGFSPVVLNDFYLTDAFYNLAGVRDANLDNVLIAAQSERMPEPRRELYGQAQQLILEQASVLPVTEYVNLVGAAPEVSGLRFDHQGWFPYLVELQVAGQ
jgi:peptide/nickel transport system substrate-binding protein